MQRAPTRRKDGRCFAWCHGGAELSADRSRRHTWAQKFATEDRAYESRMQENEGLH